VQQQIEQDRAGGERLTHFGGREGHRWWGWIAAEETNHFGGRWGTVVPVCQQPSRPSTSV
jgi:hypothetical protein